MHFGVHNRPARALAQNLADMCLIANSLEGVLGLAVSGPDPAAAARLYGATEALREAMGTLPIPLQRKYLDEMMAAARAVLGEEAVAAARAQGRAISLDEAIAYAGAVAAAAAGQPSGVPPGGVSGGPV